MLKVYSVKCKITEDIFSKYSEKIVSFATKYTPTLFKFITNGNMNASFTIFNHNFPIKKPQQDVDSGPTNNNTLLTFNINPMRYLNIKLGYKKNKNQKIDIINHLLSSIYSDIYIGSSRNLVAIGNLTPSANISQYNVQYTTTKMLISFPENNNQSEYIIDNLTSDNMFIQDLMLKKESFWAGFSLYGISLCINNNKSFTTSYTYLTKKEILLCEVGCSGIYKDEISKDMIKEIFLLSQYLSSLIGSFKYNIQKKQLSILFGLSLFGFLENIHFYNTILSVISFIVNPNIILEMLNFTELKLIKIDIAILYIFALQIMYHFINKTWSIALLLNLKMFNKGVNVHMSTKHQFKDDQFNSWVNNDFVNNHQKS